MNTRETGNEAETFAADWLFKKGWEILDRNFCMKGGELDIIAKKGDILAFVEVRSWERQFWDGGTPLETIHPAKIKHIIKTALYYIQSRKIRMQDFNIRFDVAGLIKKDDGTFDINYVEAAFDATGY
ncbi:YraN family protein [bacterium]|nr:YraN family protein [bacterium]